MQASQVEGIQEGLIYYNPIQLASILKMCWWCGDGVNIAKIAIGPVE